MQIEQPYVQYMYSYPHKTAYRKLTDCRIEPYLLHLQGQENSLYFHIPFCEYKCGYCNLFSIASASESMMQKYIDAMQRQADQIAAELPENVVFSDVTLGGGTPLLLPEHLLAKVFAIAQQTFDVSLSHTDVIVETSPNQTTKEKLLLLKQNGVKRLSMGIQSLQQEELKTLHRFHDADTARKAMKMIQEIKFECVNYDIIYGIPGQTKESLLQSLEGVIAFAPDELFVYPLYVKQGTTLYQEGIKPAQQTLELYQTARQFLKEHGYDAQSMRRFVKRKEGTEERKKESLCGFGNTLSIGCGGRSYLGNLHFCTPYAVKRSHCLAQLEKYMNTIDYRTITYGYCLSKEEQKRRYVIKHLLFGIGISRSDYRNHFKAEVEQEFPLLQQFVAAGYVVLSPEYITLTEDGLAYSDYLGPQFVSDEVALKMQEWRDKMEGEGRQLDFE